eukprot:2916881-Rhodomonas_salina.2
MDICKHSICLLLRPTQRQQEDPRQELVNDGSPKLRGGKGLDFGFTASQRARTNWISFQRPRP